MNARGWCPGALRPMRTGDGLLVRLRITGGILAAALAREIAACARSYGNGAIDLSNRGNLQLRGVTESFNFAAQDRMRFLLVASIEEREFYAGRTRIDRENCVVHAEAASSASAQEITRASI